MNVDRSINATARRDGRWWFVDIAELDVSGQARDVDEIDEVAREVAGLALNLNPDFITATVTIEIPEDARTSWERSKELAARAREDERLAAALARQAVETLRRGGLTQKETGRLLGLSAQRIHQLEGGTKPRAQHKSKPAKELVS